MILPRFEELLGDGSDIGMKFYICTAFSRWFAQHLF